MATRFEVVLYGKNLVSLRAAGEEALNEIQRLDHQLNLYNPTSEIAHINARAARESVRVEPGLFRLLEHARRLHQETHGAFDITVGPLLRCWGFMGGERKIPSAKALAQARTQVGMGLVHLDSTKRTVRFGGEGVMLDLGAIGKGYAIEQAIKLLRECGVTSAILHGGTSTIYAIGEPPDAPGWKVAIEYPAKEPGASPRLISMVVLKNEALSVSAGWGKSFQVRDKTYGHILDPRTGKPVSKAVLSAVILTSATETDALSTALLTLGARGHDHIASLRRGMRTLVMWSEGRTQFRFRNKGIEAPRSFKLRAPHFPLHT